MFSGGCGFTDAVCQQELLTEITVVLLGQHWNVFMTDLHIFQHRFSVRGAVKQSHLLKRLWSKQSFQKMFICTPRLKKWNVIRGVGRRKLVIILFSKAELTTELKNIVSDYRTVQNSWATPHFFIVCFQSALLKWFHFHFSPCLWPFSGFSSFLFLSSTLSIIRA